MMNRITNPDRPHTITRWVREGDHYELRLPLAGALAVVVKTGTRRDNYPWEWRLADGIEARRTQGTSDTMASAKDSAESALRAAGVIA